MVISFLLPMFHKVDLLRMALKVNDVYRTPNVEVVLVLDEPSEEAAVLNLVRENSDIHFRVIVNDWDHAWRPPCIALNVGVRHALADHVVFMSPECMLVLPRPDYLQQLIAKDFRMCYAGVCWAEDDFKVEDSPGLLRHKIQVSEATHPAWLWGFGFLLAPKLAVERIFGYDESRTTYGWDDNDIRSRLTRLGNRFLIDGQIKVFHAMHPNEFREQSERVLPSPNVALFNQRDTWGTAFNRVAWDWTKPQ